jgi:predicted transcriptional regulator
MQRYSISQLPVVRDGELDSLADVIGSLQDRDLLERVFRNPDALHEDVASAM